MAERFQKDLIIKLKLPDPDLQQLLEISENTGLSLSILFEYFIHDLIHEETDESQTLMDWLCRRANPQYEGEEDDKLIQFSDKQVEIMNLLDLILEN